MTTIEWTRGDDGSEGKTWNPVAGCSLASAGCQNCYAMKFAHRFAGPGQRYEGLTELGKHGPRWTGEVRELPHRLAEPLKWKKPRRIFVNSMSDLFHADVSNEFIAAVFGVMAAAPQHQFLILTKRAARLRDWFAWIETAAIRVGVHQGPRRKCVYEAERRTLDADGLSDLRVDMGYEGPWPLPNVWLGVSCEDQATADERIPLLLQAPAAVRWVSAEPLLGPIDLQHVQWPNMHRVDVLRGGAWEFGGFPGFTQHSDMKTIGWVVVGSESGPGARQMEASWARQIVDDCQVARAPVFTKQIATPEGRAHGDPKGGDPQWWPAGDWPREFPL